MVFGTFKFSSTLNLEGRGLIIVYYEVICQILKDYICFTYCVQEIRFICYMHVLVVHGFPSNVLIKLYS